MKIQESAENYLETILRLKLENGTVRSIDIARAMEFTKPSVSRAMSLFRENGYIIVEDGGSIMLTPSGLEIAERTFRRHNVLRDWLKSIGVSPAVAAEDACRLEHAMSEETFAHIAAIYEKKDS